MDDEIPFDEIKETEDRSWSLLLVEALEYGAESNRGSIVEALSKVADRRTEQPLLALVLDPRKPSGVRKAASDVLFRIGSYETTEERAQWWASNDPVIVRHALLMTEPADAARVKTVAADPLHSLYHEAVRTMEFWEPPEFQRLVMRALDHKNPRVRETAARCLLWEQPVAAEKRLLELASEADEDVAIAALDTLIYCSSREILLELDSLRNNGPQSLRDCYENTFDHVQGDFILAMPGQATEPDEKAYLLAWLKPVRHLMKKRRKKPRKTYKKSRNEVEIEKPEITARSIMDDLSDVDGMWYQKKNRYYGVAWAAFNNEDRKLLKSFFEQHSDAWVRDLGTRAFSAWQDVDAILSNLYDRDFSVLKRSAYCSRFLEPNLEIAMRLRELIEDPNVMNNFAKEALESYVYHARNGETYDWLLDLSKHDSRPSIRYAAVSELDSAETRSRIKELIPILEEPPANEWKVHCSILRACERSWLSQSTIEHLMSIDNLFLQTEIASSVVGA